MSFLQKKKVFRRIKKKIRFFPKGTFTRCRQVIYWFMIRCFFKQQSVVINKSVNDTDLYTYEPIKHIPSQYLIMLKSEGHYYGFDVRTAIVILQKFHGVNPYNNVEFNDGTKLQVQKRIGLLYRLGLKTGFAEFEASLCSRTVNVFQEMIALDFYVNPDWFLELNLAKMRRLYQSVSHIWNSEYIMPEVRAQITQQQIFSLPKSRYVQYSKDKLGLTILSDLEHMISESSVENRKLGAIYFLMGFVKVSEPAAISFPDICFANE